MELLIVGKQPRAIFEFDERANSTGNAIAKDLKTLWR